DDFLANRESSPLTARRIQINLPPRLRYLHRRLPMPVTDRQAGRSRCVNEGTGVTASRRHGGPASSQLGPSFPEPVCLLPVRLTQGHGRHVATAARHHGAWTSAPNV